MGLGCCSSKLPETKVSSIFSKGVCPTDGRIRYSQLRMLCVRGTVNAKETIEGKCHIYAQYIPVKAVPDSCSA